MTDQERIVALEEKVAKLSKALRLMIAAQRETLEAVRLLRSLGNGDVV